MNDYFVSPDIESVFNKKIRLPTAVAWNRLEGRPRRAEFGRALQAEVRDPLWLITRQWQMGEFEGEDAGSPIVAKVAWRSDPLSKVHAPDGAEAPYDAALPLESLVEARPITLARGSQPQNLDLCVLLGRRWQKLLVARGHGSLVGAFLTRYPINAPTENAETDFTITAHAGTWQTFAACAGRRVNGGALLHHLERPGARASDDLGLVDPIRSEVDALGDEFLAWARKLFHRPGELEGTWRPRHLEYSVQLSVPRGETPAAFGAPEYRGGRLDWFHFDAVPTGPRHEAGSAAPLHATSFLPATAQFDGMPHTRHWTFEEGAVHFGGVQPDTTDLAKLLLLEFGLVFANDWFLLPMELPVGSATTIEGLVVTNVFGERFWVDAAVSGGEPTERFRMFRLSSAGATDDRLFLPPATAASLQSSPVESVSFVRDEVANMVWGVETTVQLPDGSSRRGREVATELHAKYRAAVVPVPPTEPSLSAKVRYNLMTSVAEHWIPFIPVHVVGDNRETQLQRAAMPRLLSGGGAPPKKVLPRTQLLGVGLDGGAPAPYFIAEEDVERSGTVVETRWQRCRWLDGRVVTWLSHQRKVGRGEGSSGLAFDTLEPTRHS